jgi:hypothetical protein
MGREKTGGGEERVAEVMVIEERKEGIWIRESFLLILPTMN